MPDELSLPIVQIIFAPLLDSNRELRYTVHTWARLLPRRRNDGKGQRFPILYDILFTPDQLADGVQIYDKTALQTQAPVIDRVDSFRVNDFSAASIALANTSYPIFREGELLGAVVFEQTAEIVDKGIKKLEATRQALSSFQNKPPTISFSGYTFANVIGGCPKLREAVELARRVAPQDSPILLVGETGTGKEIFAQSIPRASRRLPVCPRCHPH